MRWVSWTSDNGQTVVFDQTGPYFYGGLTSALGATAATARAPWQDGVTTYYATLDARSVTLTGAMWVMGSRTKPAAAAYDGQRTLLCQAFAPNRWGTLVYYREDGAVQVRCRPVAAPTISPPVGTYSAVSIDFTADGPYWESAREYLVALGVTQRFLRFPWAPRLGPLGAYGHALEVDNPTTELIYPVAEVYTTGQYVTLTNRTTGKAVRIEHSIAEDQKLVVDLRDVTAFLYTRDAAGDFGDPEDVSHWMSLDSEPWGIVPGHNRVAITNNVAEETPRAFVRYRLPYLGV